MTPHRVYDDISGKAQSPPGTATTIVPPHPAKFSPRILDTITDLLHDRPDVRRVLDPFAGVGGVHQLHDRLGLDTVGIELQPAWAAAHPRTLVGDALHLPFDPATFDAIVTSPTYGNRYADHHTARDASRRRSYTHDYGRPLEPGNSGTLHWGDAYRAFHRAAWCEALRVLRPGGLFVLNISDHVRNRKRQPVAGWHVGVLQGEGLVVEDIVPVVTPRQRHGANSDARPDAELVVVLRQPGPRPPSDDTNART